jgi:hypothetical protein
MNDPKQKRLDLLCRLREMNVEQARADHVAAQAELEQRREKADDTARRIEALDQWSIEQLSRGEPLAPELLRQAQLYRGVEKSVLDTQRSEEASQRERTDAVRGGHNPRFEELSVVERLTVRHVKAATDTQIRRGFVDLDEAGVLAKNLESKE